MDAHSFGHDQNSFQISLKQFSACCLLLSPRVQGTSGIEHRRMLLKFPCFCFDSGIKFPLQGQNFTAQNVTFSFPLEDFLQKGDNHIFKNNVNDDSIVGFCREQIEPKRKLVSWRTKHTSSNSGRPLEILYASKYIGFFYISLKQKPTMFSFHGVEKPIQESLEQGFDCCCCCFGFFFTKD